MSLLTFELIINLVPNRNITDKIVPAIACITKELTDKSVPFLSKI